MTPFLLENFCEKVLFVDFHKQSQKARVWQKWSFLRGQHQALLSVLSPQLWLGMPFMTNTQVPLILKGKTLLRWAPVRQAWSSAGIIYEKVMAQFLNTNRWEREKAGAWMKNIFKNSKKQKYRVHTGIFCVQIKLSPCTPINISEEHSSKQVWRQTSKKK